MSTTIQIIASILLAVGFGAILGAYFQARFQHQKEVKEDIHNLKRQRYGAILIQMLTIINPKRGLSKTQVFRPDLKSIDDFKEEVKTETLNSLLFAGDNVIKSMVDFINDPTQSSYIKTAVTMRIDLWGKKTSIDEKLFTKLYE